MALRTSLITAISTPVSAGFVQMYEEDTTMEIGTAIDSKKSHYDVLINYRSIPVWGKLKCAVRGYVQSFLNGWYHGGHAVIIT